tara:strand:+ start:24015 stop:24986 length:972 start_codon:yes stop_codon:yes gene_type:complete
MAATTPNKGLPYLFDGSTNNEPVLALSLRALDVISNLVLESQSEQQTPLTPEPGQAWFIEKSLDLDSTRTAGVDDFWTQTFGAATRESDLIVFFGILERANALVPEDVYGWSGIPIQESAYGYIKDLNGRYQWDGTEWLPQQKIQTLTFRQGFNAPGVAGEDPPGEIPEPGGIQFYQVAVAPFDMQVTFVEILHHGYEGVAGSVPLTPAAVLPGIYYSDDNTDTFPANWTMLVAPGYQVSASWFATSAFSYAQEAHTTSGVKAKAGAPIFSTTIPAGSYIAIGGWDRFAVTPNGTVYNGPANNQSLDSIAEIQIRFDYFDATT